MRNLSSFVEIEKYDYSREVRWKKSMVVHILNDYPVFPILQIVVNLLLILTALFLLRVLINTQLHINCRFNSNFFLHLLVKTRLTDFSLQFGSLASYSSSWLTFSSEFSTWLMMVDFCLRTWSNQVYYTTRQHWKQFRSSTKLLVQTRDDVYFLHNLCRSNDYNRTRRIISQSRIVLSSKSTGQTNIASHDDTGNNVFLDCRERYLWWVKTFSALKKNKLRWPLHRYWNGLLHIGHYDSFCMRTKIDKKSMVWFRSTHSQFATVINAMSNCMENVHWMLDIR